MRITAEGGTVIKEATTKDEAEVWAKAIPEFDDVPCKQKIQFLGFTGVCTAEKGHVTDHACHNSYGVLMRWQR